MNPQELIAEVLEHIRGMWRYRWLAAGVAWLMSVAGWFYVYSMPNVYLASAQVFVDTNSLLRPLMQGLTAQEDPLDEVQLMTRAVLTRPNLENVARKTDLTLRAETPRDIESIVTGLQQGIRISGGRENIFSIQYENTSRSKSVDVVTAVLDAFVENAIGNQDSDTDMTEHALRSEIKSHEDRLVAAESELADFKRENLGYMPNAAGDYYSQLQAAIAAVGQTEEQVRLLTERRDELRRQIQGEEPVFGIMSATAFGGGAACSLGGQIAALETQLSALRVEFTDKHPRIFSLQETIADLEERCAAELENEDASLAPYPEPSVEQPLEANPVYQNLRIQLSSADVELAALRSELSARRDAVARLRRDVDKIVQVETQLKQLNRDYAVVQARYQQLLGRWEDLQATQRLDPVTDTVKFRRIEPPFAEADPVGPNRPTFLLAVFVLALGAGIALAFGLNQVNPAFFTRRGLRQAVDLPVLGSISMITTQRSVTKKRIELILLGGTYLTLGVATALVIAFAEPGSELFRRLLQGAGV